ncbi:MAG: hypothetical protein CVT92_07170 [Bacteroidetes bacterium HGW-Bacteroidetes-1]|jgi:hypothetical protein|nr:MAG: hypothetical protein CVT92_07170 [Bacteroidetes bacterium HGW-Bacteroidetes-1]
MKNSLTLETSTKLYLFFSLVLVLNLFAQSEKVHAQHDNSQFITLTAIVRLPIVLKESSGIIVSHPNRIWSHNDSGNDNEIYCFDTTGILIRTVEITNIANIDWEDLATDTEGRIFINDAGNNNNNRTDLAIHVIANPEEFASNTIQASTIHFTLNDQVAFPPPLYNRNFDIEGIAWHNDSLLLFTKNRSTPMNGYCKMYRLSQNPGIQTAFLIDSVYLGSANSDAQVTAASINHATKDLLLLTQTKIIAFKHPQDGNYFKGLKTVYPFSFLPGQVESIDYVDDFKVYISEEGDSNQSGYLYKVDLPDATGLSANFENISFTKKIIDQFLFIALNNPEDQINRLEICNINGVAVVISPRNNQSINLSNLPNGIYILKIFFNKGILTDKIAIFHS